MDGHAIQYVDAGGGFGVPYRPSHSYDFAADIAKYAQAVLEPLFGLNVHVLLEPGRSVVAPTGVLLTRVLYRKTNGRKTLSDRRCRHERLLRPSLYRAYHEIVPVTTEPAAARESTDVVGPVCETGDFFARDRELPVVDEGGLLAILDAGAYGMSLASNYNTRPRPAEVLVEGKRARLIRKRETFRDLVRSEC